MKKILTSFRLRLSKNGFSQRTIRYLAQTVYLAPLIVGLAAAYLFAFVPQMQEIYLGVVEDADFGRGLSGLLALSLFSALLYAWNQVEVSKRIDAIYPDHADIYFDRDIVDVRDLKTGFAASLPYFGLLIGLAEVFRHVREAANAGLPEGALPRLPGLPEAVIAAATIALIAYLATLSALHLFRKSVKTQQRILHGCYGAALFLVAAPIVHSDATLIASRLAGPLAGAALVLIELAVAARFSLWFLGKFFKAVLAAPSAILMLAEPLPRAVRHGAALLLPLGAVAVIAASIMGTPIVREELIDDETADTGVGDIAEKFRVWLAERKTGPRYPVFIVAAQGGGIYAASSTGAFLATMQDHCPAFARHVFAISAVSGGSVGATLFNAAFADSIARGTNRKAAVDVEPGCDSLFEKPGELSKRLTAITQEDHISPVLAYLLPDVISPLFAGFIPKSKCALPAASSYGRDNILEKSFLYSFRLSDPSLRKRDYTVCPRAADRNLMLQPFSKVWSEKGDAPALLLNATWVETGYRVAFSPFDLKPIGAGTLYSFENLKNKPSDPPLIQAAIISARFPGIMPPWTFKLDRGSRWTFVDGGYADSSGAATALQLYNRLRVIGGDDVDLHLITLTDKFKALTPRDIKPTGLAPAQSFVYDALSPVTTLLSVRELQSRKAVTEAHAQLGNKMIVVQLDQKAYPLPLGWKLSGLSSDVIRLTIGDPARCPKTSEGGDTPAMIADRNSCELKRIVDLLAPKTTAARTLFPQAVAPKIIGSWQVTPQ